MISYTGRGIFSVHLILSYSKTTQSFCIHGAKTHRICVNRYANFYLQTAAAGTAARPRPAVTVKTASAKTLNIDAEVEINGVGTFDYDIDSLKQEDMPWRKPGKLPFTITVW